MIAQFYLDEPNETIRRMEKIEQLLNSRDFLVGLSETSPEYLQTYSRVSELGYALNMSSDQSIWDRPRPWPYEYFPAILGDELSSVPKQKIGIEEVYAIKSRLRSAYGGKSSISLAMSVIQEIVGKKIAEIVSRERIEACLASEEFSNFDAEAVISRVLPALVTDHFCCFLQWAHFLPFEDGVKLSAFTDVYGFGGVPVGWVNDTQDVQEVTDPEDEDYDEFWEDETVLGPPETCLRVLYL